MKRPVHKRPNSHRRVRSKAGQALLESFGIMMLLCFILFGIVQYVLMLSATEVIQYSADASVRARAVGFNPFMVYKVNRIASIPNAGLMTSPSRQSMGNAAAWQQRNAGQSYFSSIRSNPGSPQYYNIEQFNIPLFLGTTHWGQMYSLLDYEEWDTISRPLYTTTSGNTVGVTVTQDYRLRMPFARAFSDRDTIRIRQEARLADHAELYLQ